MADFDIIRTIGNNTIFGSLTSCLVNDDFVYFVDSGSDAIECHYLNGGFTGKITGLVSVIDIARVGDVVVVASTATLKFYSLDLAIQYGSQSISGCVGCDADKENIFAIDSTSNKVRKYSRLATIDKISALQGAVGSKTYGKLWVSRNLPCIYVVNETDNTIEVYNRDSLSYLHTIATPSGVTSIKHIIEDGYFLYIIEAAKITVLNIGSYDVITSKVFVGTNYVSGFHFKDWLLLVNSSNGQIDIMNGYDFKKGFKSTDEFGIADMKPVIVGVNSVISEDTTDDNSFIEGPRKTNYSSRWKS